MPSLMIVGTTSGAGKTLITAAICRILACRGHRVTPFKGQNMSLNAYVTQTGGEMGYAQAIQAWAAKTTPQVSMNPILLKPQGDMTSQVIFNGQIVGQTTAANYYQDYFNRGWQTITSAIDSLIEQYDWLVCEGAGSPAEVNLKHRDLTNMRVAKYLQAPTILVVDIDRGGSFAHVVGTLQLLDPDERELIKGIIINKFRGDKSLLDSGLLWLEEYTQVPVLGVIPWLNLAIPAEDSLDLLERSSRKSQAEINISVIKLPRIANFTDFDPLEAESTVSLKYVSLNQNLGMPDAVILPGSKTTGADLDELYKSGMAKQIEQYLANGGTILGVCAGFQMLGQQLKDPQLAQGNILNQEGLGLLPMSTTFTQEKITKQRQVISKFLPIAQKVTGYEIHQGISEYSNRDFLKLFEDESLGIVNHQLNVWGTYLHGIFENGTWRRQWLNILRKKKGLVAIETDVPDYSDLREIMLDELANLIEPHLDHRFQSLLTNGN
jgi:adenosylcobyric acid synthase